MSDQNSSRHWRAARCSLRVVRFNYSRNGTERCFYYCEDPLRGEGVGKFAGRVGGGRKIRQRRPTLQARSLRFFSPVNFGVRTDLVIFATDNSTGTRTLNLAKSMKLYSGAVFFCSFTGCSFSMLFFWRVRVIVGVFFEDVFCLISLLFPFRMTHLSFFYSFLYVKRLEDFDFFKNLIIRYLILSYNDLV